jgi:hypothetical protein
MVAISVRFEDEARPALRAFEHIFREKFHEVHERAANFFNDALEQGFQYRQLVGPNKTIDTIAWEARMRGIAPTHNLVFRGDLEAAVHSKPFTNMTLGTNESITMKVWNILPKYMKSLETGFIVQRPFGGRINPKQVKARPFVIEAIRKAGLAYDNMLLSMVDEAVQAFNMTPPIYPHGSPSFWASSFVPARGGPLAIRGSSSIISQKTGIYATRFNNATSNAFKGSGNRFYPGGRATGGGIPPSGGGFTTGAGSLGAKGGAFDVGDDLKGSSFISDKITPFPSGEVRFKSEMTGSFGLFENIKYRMFGDWKGWLLVFIPPGSGIQYYGMFSDLKSVLDGGWDDSHIKGVVFAWMFGQTGLSRQATRRKIRFRMYNQVR